MKVQRNNNNNSNPIQYYNLRIVTCPQLIEVRVSPLCELKTKSRVERNPSFMYKFIFPAFSFNKELFSLLVNTFTKPFRTWLAQKRNILIINKFCLLYIVFLG